jgi:hypothetical protein
VDIHSLLIGFGNFQLAVAFKVDRPRGVIQQGAGVSLKRLFREDYFVSGTDGDIIGMRQWNYTEASQGSTIERQNFAEIEHLFRKNPFELKYSVPMSFISPIPITNQMVLSKRTSFGCKEVRVNHFEAAPQA